MPLLRPLRPAWRVRRRRSSERSASPPWRLRRPAPPLRPPARGGAAQPAGARRPARADLGPGPAGTVRRDWCLFAHGSGSSRLSSRNRWVADVLQQHGLATLLFDLLSDDEAADRRKVFDIELLRRAGGAGPRLDRRAGRHWPAEPRPVRCEHRCGRGAVRGGGAPGPRSAVVSRGGRPDLAGGSCLQCRRRRCSSSVARDREVLALNRQALRELRCEKRLEVVPGATHLFEEPGTLEQRGAACRRVV